ncbi:MAG: WbqC family protein [Verrucomicrobiota bacterium]
MTEFLLIGAKKTPCIFADLKKVAIIQSNYIPWRGYFDVINQVDEFILLDEVQFTRRDWRNRNKIKTHSGTRWLTIPVLTKGKYLQSISETQVEDSSWAEHHWSSIEHAYRKAPFYDALEPFLRSLYEQAQKKSLLSEINRIFLEGLCHELGISTKLRGSFEYELVGKKTERLLSICQQAGATTYLSGPAAKSYLDESMFAGEGIAVDWVDYSGYPDYAQLHGEFDGAVSVLDLLFNTGRQARDYMLSFR